MFIWNFTHRKVKQLINLFNRDEPEQYHYSAGSISLAYRLPGVSTSVKHPVYGDDILMHVVEIIMDLNDVHGWSRETIADWLETLDIDMEFKSAKT